MTNDAVVQPVTWVEPHSVAWWEAFTEAATALCLTSVEAYAQARLRRGAAAYYDDSAEVLAMEALGDVAAGYVVWTPASGPLHLTLCRRVRQLLRRARERAAKTVRMDHLGPTDRDGDTLEAQMSANPYAAEALDRIRAMPKVLAYLHALTLDDVIAHRYLRARLDGVSDPRALARGLGVTTAEVHAARKRLVRLAHKANPSALAVMTSLLRKVGTP